MPTLYLDIETIPTQRDEVRDFLSAKLRDQLMSDMEAVRAPSNYKDAEKIEAYCAEKRKELQDTFAQKLADTINATGLDGSFGHVFCIGWAFDDEPVSTLRDLDEALVLREFAKRCKVPANENFSVTVVGHNVSAFDLRFLAQRHIVHGIRPPMHIARAAQAKPWESEKVFDTMVQWAGVGQKISLDRLCLALSIPSPKGEFDGSQVWPMVQAGKHDDVARYCERDVEAVRCVHRRMVFLPPHQTFAEAA